MPNWALFPGQPNSCSPCRACVSIGHAFPLYFLHILLMVFLSFLHPLWFLLSPEAGQIATEPSLCPLPSPHAIYISLFPCFLSPGPLRAEASLIDMMRIPFMLMILPLHIQVCSHCCPVCHSWKSGTQHIWNAESLPHSKMGFPLNFFISIKSTSLLVTQGGIIEAIFASSLSLPFSSLKRTVPCHRARIASTCDLFYPLWEWNQLRVHGYHSTLFSARRKLYFIEENNYF